MIKDRVDNRGPFIDTSLMFAKEGISDSQDDASKSKQDLL